MKYLRQFSSESEYLDFKETTDFTNSFINFDGKITSINSEKIFKIINEITIL